MPPVGFVETKGTKRLRFTRNTSYNGTDYGPDYPQDTCDVENRYAYQFVGQRRAVEIKAKPEPMLPPASSEVQVRDPAVQHRDPVVAPADGVVNTTVASKRPRGSRGTRNADRVR